MNQPAPASSAAALDAATILAATDRAPLQPLYVAEWGGTVFIQEMTGAERDAFELACLTPQGTMTRENSARAWPCSWCAMSTAGGYSGPIK